MFIGRTDVETETSVLWHLMQRVDSLEKTLMLEKIEGGRRRGRQMVGWHHRLEELVTDREAWSAAVHGLQRVRYG